MSSENVCKTCEEIWFDRYVIAESCEYVLFKRKNHIARRKDVKTTGDEKLASCFLCSVFGIPGPAGLTLDGYKKTLILVGVFAVGTILAVSILLLISRADAPLVVFMFITMGAMVLYIRWMWNEARRFSYKD